jgi:large subunit ribosomal protein L3
VIELGPNFVVQKKSIEKEGYTAIQIGFAAMREKRSTKPVLGHLRKAGLGALRFMRESRLGAQEAEAYSPGDEIKADYFTAGDIVDVVGTSRGRGFAGVMKRHKMHGALSMTHGTHEYDRHGGSIGSSATPSRVLKGKRMPGRMGNVRTTVQNLRVVEVRPEENLLLVKGAVPGSRNGLVIVQKAIKRGA